MATAASWTPDSRTLYVTDSAAANSLPENVAAGISGHTDTMYVYNSNTGWTSYPLPCSSGAGCATPSSGGRSLAITVPSVGAYTSGSPTVAHTWCPQGTVGDYQSMSFYPLGDTVYTGPDNTYPPLLTDVLAATNDGTHILGTTLTGNRLELSDIGLTIPTGGCTVTTTGTAPNQVETLEPLLLSHVLNQTQISQVNASAITQVNQIVTSPASNLAFITYSASEMNFNAVLPYYQPVVGSPGTLGTVGYVTLTGASANSGPTAPVAGAFSPDDSLFFCFDSGGQPGSLHRRSDPYGYQAACARSAGMYAGCAGRERLWLRVHGERNHRAGYGHCGEAAYHDVVLKRGEESRRRGRPSAGLLLSGASLKPACAR